MNERIKKLAEQAGCGIDGMGYGEGNIEGLAELIVQECGIVADKWVDDEDNGKNLVSEKLKQHFGVK